MIYKYDDSQGEVIDLVTEKPLSLFTIEHLVAGPFTSLERTDGTTW